MTESLESSLVEKWELMCSEWEAEGVQKTKKNLYATDGVSKYPIVRGWSIKLTEGAVSYLRVTGQEGPCRRGTGTP